MTTSANACFSRLRRDILTGHYAPGERLPPERRLARDLGVGRVTVRSALARLASANLLTVRQGSGYVVQDYRREGGPDLLRDVVEIAENSGTFTEVAGDLLHVRRHLACAVLERLGNNPISADDFARLTHAVDAFEAAAEGDLEDLIQRDLDVLSALLDATGSAVLRLCLNPISSMLMALPRLASAMYATPAENVLAWRGLCGALSGTVPLDSSRWLQILEARDAETLKGVAQIENAP